MNEREYAAVEKTFWDAFTFDVATNTWSLADGLGPVDLYERCVAKEAAFRQWMESR